MDAIDLHATGDENDNDIDQLDEESTILLTDDDDESSLQTPPFSSRQWKRSRIANVPLSRMDSLVRKFSTEQRFLQFNPELDDNHGGEDDEFHVGARQLSFSSLSTTESTEDGEEGQHEVAEAELARTLLDEGGVGDGPVYLSLELYELDDSREQVMDANDIPSSECPTFSKRRRSRSRKLFVLRSSRQRPKPLSRQQLARLHAMS